MDLFNLGATPQELAANLDRSRCRWLVVSFSSDWLFPPEQSREIVETLISLDKPVSYCNVASACGHDAFLLPDDLPVYGEMMRAFLEPAARRVRGGTTTTISTRRARPASSIRSGWITTYCGADPGVGERAGPRLRARRTAGAAAQTREGAAGRDRAG